MISGKLDNRTNLIRKIKNIRETLIGKVGYLEDVDVPVRLVAWGTNMDTTIIYARYLPMDPSESNTLSRDDENAIQFRNSYEDVPVMYTKNSRCPRLLKK